jgi:pimeloyl-ACP methyl ester carboxylesterase
MRRLIRLGGAVASIGLFSGVALGQSIHAGGAVIHYEIQGAGPPLLLIHGFGSCGRQTWGPYVEDLEAHYRLIIVDLPGNGASTNPSGVFTHRQAAVDMFALLDSLGIRRVRAIGMSSGGMVLLHMATQQPSRIDAMVVVSATSYFPEQARQILRQVANPDNIPPPVKKQYAECATRGEAQVRQLEAQFSGFKDSYNDMNFTPPLLATIQARTLIVHGDRDPFFPVAIPIELYQAIPRAQLWIVPNTGHEFPQSKAAFVKTVLTF